MNYKYKMGLGSSHQKTPRSGINHHPSTDELHFYEQLNPLYKVVHRYRHKNRHQATPKSNAVTGSQSENVLPNFTATHKSSSPAKVSLQESGNSDGSRCTNPHNKCNKDGAETEDECSPEQGTGEAQNIRDTDLGLLTLGASRNLSRPPPFSLNQKSVVVESWEVVQFYIQHAGVNAFKELFERSPETMNAFGFLKHLDQEDREFYIRLKDHVFRVYGMLSLLVAELNRDPAKADKQIANIVFALGQRHFGYGAKIHQIELLGHAMVEALLPLFGGYSQAKQDEVKDSISAFFRVIIFWVRIGFEYVQSRGFV